MFDTHYEVILANTEASRAIHRKIRYQVYCLEHGFEDPAAFPSGEEYDRWDARAAQFIVRQRTSGQWVAAMRIILPNTASFPLEALQCLDSTHPERLHRRQLGEVSRVCVIRSPNPNTVNRYLDRDFGSVSKTGESEVLMGLIRALILYGFDRGIEHYYILITGAFARLLRRLGVVLHQVGIPIEHRGWRTPYLMGLRKSVASMSQRSNQAHELFARKALAYRLFSTLDNDLEVLLEQMLQSLSLPNAAVRLPQNARRFQPNPEFWRLETEQTQSGPDAWRIKAERSKIGSDVWRNAVLG